MRIVSHYIVNKDTLTTKVTSSDNIQGPSVGSVFCHEIDHKYNRLNEGVTIQQENTNLHAPLELKSPQQLTSTANQYHPVLQPLSDKKKKNTKISNKRSPKGIIKISNPMVTSYPTKEQNRSTVTIITTSSNQNLQVIKSPPLRSY